MSACLNSKYKMVSKPRKTWATIHFFVLQKMEKMSALIY